MLDNLNKIQLVDISDTQKHWFSCQFSYKISPCWWLVWTALMIVKSFIKFNAYHSKRFKNYSILRMVLLCLKESCFPDCWKVSLVVLVFKACVRYFLTNFYFSPNDNPAKIMKDVFYFI